MKKFIPILLLTIIFGCNGNSTGYLSGLINHSEKQLECAVKEVKEVSTESLVSPRSIEDGKIRIVPAKDWTSGFFPGNLWMMYELTGKNEWKEIATEHTIVLKDEMWNGADHDMGFKMYCSFGNAVKHDANPEYRDILLQSAKTLSTRFSPVVGCIRSWNSNPKTAQWKYPVIIDNMMNLELLLWAAKETGNESYKEIAVQHATKTMNNHFRADYSSYHVVDYDPETGEAIAHNTHQGYADESAWSRGQAWGLYGFTMMYRETGIKDFLVFAENIASYIINQKGVREGKIPYWDFNDPAIPNAPYDASAAAVISSALFELYEYSANKEHLEVAQKLLATLSTDEFLCKVGEEGGFLLKHSTGSFPFKSEIDVPIVYADYYFLESIIRSKKYEEIKK